METQSAVAVLGALAQETRLEIVRLLIRYGRDGLPAGRIAASLGLNPATLSFHLSALRNAGLISSNRASRQIIYRADFGTVDDLVGYLLANCCSACDVPARPEIAEAGVGARESSARAPGRQDMGEVECCPPESKR